MRLPIVVGLLALLNSAYLLGAGNSSLFFVANILGHLLIGPLAVWLWFRTLRKTGSQSRLASVAAVLSAFTGIVLLLVGNTNDTRMVFWIHVVVAGVAALLVLRWLAGISSTGRKQVAIAVSLAVAAFALPALKSNFDSRQTAITNSILPPLDLAGESMDGRKGPFFPSAAETATKDLIPGDFFLESEGCAESGCHTDAFDQWESSAHHFSSFNNPWYKKSIEYMQDVVGTGPAQWCAGCHDPALLFAGQMDQPVDSFINTPEATAGLACVACHSISAVKNTMGNGGYVIEYPAMHKLASSGNRIVKSIHDLVIRANPEPHRRTFFKDFHLEQSDQFCVSCHKVHMDVDVNNYRWIRGFNTYDNWQASGVSGQGARSFYDPPVGRTCVDCHMPSVPSVDAGNDSGTIKSHRFAAANTAVPAMNADSIQLAEVSKFLSSNQLLVDIFGMSESDSPRTAGEETGTGDRIATQFAVGEEQSLAIGSGSVTREAIDFVGPLTSANAVLRAGSSIRLDVVVRTLGVGHFFPSGTVDAQEAWIELKAVDDTGETIFWSGWVADDNGPVDSSAHFFRSVVLDGHGNPINKRNAFATRSVAYINLIPPSAADVAHYRIQVPNESGTLTVTASVHYRKFNWWFNQFTFNGVTSSDDSLKSLAYDDREWVFADVHPGVTLPIVTMATESRKFVIERDPKTSVEDTVAEASDNQTQVRRLYDYGIGLFLEGDLRSAEVAFRRAERLDPTNINIPINLARVALAEGALEPASEAVGRALAIDPGSPKAHFFNGLLHKSRGEYESALTSLRITENAFPKDRVVLNEIGRILFLDNRPGEAIPWFERVLRIDPEDLMAHYNLMLCYRAAGMTDVAVEHEKRYKRYKDDESSAALSLRYRQRNPYDNNEAIRIHEHVGRLP